jgi:3-deoxy-D-manno-octulosonate 8-phosphate phosphatase (KDO 8-P phosphatase)
MTTLWTDIQQAAQDTGGRFHAPPEDLAVRLQDIQGLVFDWDGVFNDGRKGPGVPSTYCEPDSMGLNMLRYGLWRRQRRLPPVALISGADNPAAIQLAQRERLPAVYLGVQDKGLALAHFGAAQGLRGEDLACAFDDINDLAMARRCGVRCLVGRAGSPFLRGYVEQARLADYTTGRPGGGGAVREVCEMLLAVMGAFASTVASRVDLDDDYRSYWQMRQRVAPAFFTQHNDRIAPLPAERAI